MWKCISVLKRLRLFTPSLCDQMLGNIPLWANLVFIMRPYLCWPQQQQLSLRDTGSNWITHTLLLNGINTFSVWDYLANVYYQSLSVVDDTSLHVVVVYSQYVTAREVFFCTLRYHWLIMMLYWCSAYLPKYSFIYSTREIKNIIQCNTRVSSSAQCNHWWLTG